MDIFAERPWNCVCGQSNDFDEEECVYCKIGKRGMSRIEWQKLKDDPEKEKERAEIEKKDRVAKIVIFLFVVIAFIYLFYM